MESFPKLPLEIRQMIWTFSLPTRRFILGCSSYGHAVTKPRYPVALHVNQEARGIALYYYTLQEDYESHPYYVDLAVDAFDNYYLQTQTRRQDLANLGGVRNIVIDSDDISSLLTTSYRLHMTKCCRGGRSSLREIIFAVYVPDTWPCEEGRDLLKEIQEDEDLIDRLCEIKTDSEKWFQEACPICESRQKYSYQKAHAIIQMPKITFAMIPYPWGQEHHPAELVPFKLSNSL